MILGGNGLAAWQADAPSRCAGHRRNADVSPAFRARAPFVVPEDGKNLNRCFPGNPAGTLADRLAHAAFTQLIVGSDALVDVLAGDLPQDLEPFAHYHAGVAPAQARRMSCR